MWLVKNECAKLTGCSVLCSVSSCACELRCVGRCIDPGAFVCRYEAPVVFGIAIRLIVIHLIGLESLGTSGNGDYGKTSIKLNKNERDITGTRTHTSNLTSIVKALMAPILDIVKSTKKENNIGNIRQSGNLGSSRLFHVPLPAPR